MTTEHGRVDSRGILDVLGAIDPVRFLWHVGEAITRELDLPCVVETSDRSESVYLHIRRGETWFGYRIANHEPFYPCSADYQQMLLPRSVRCADLQHYAKFLRQAIRVGGHAVADPAEVQARIANEERRLCDGHVIQDERGPAWRWSAREQRWIALRAGVGPMPTFQPRRSLSAHQVCRIRHRLNFLARWANDERIRGLKQP